MSHALVMVIDSNSQQTLGAFLTDDIIIQISLDLGRLRQAGISLIILFFLTRELFNNDFIAQLNALIAYKYGRSGNQFFYIMLRFSSK